jgi:hypothetical protein
MQSDPEALDALPSDLSTELSLFNTVFVIIQHFYCCTYSLMKLSPLIYDMFYLQHVLFTACPIYIFKQRIIALLFC